MKLSKSQTTDAQDLNYVNTALALDQVLGDAIALMQARKVLYANAPESQRITVEVAKLEAEQAKAYAELLAFQAEQLLITPPSDKQAEDMLKRSKKLDAMVAAATTTGAIIELTTAALRDWEATRV